MNLISFRSFLFVTIIILCTGITFAQGSIQFFGYLDLEYMDMEEMPMVMVMEDTTDMGMPMTMKKIGYMSGMNGFMFHRFNLLMNSNFADRFTAFANLEYLHGFNTAEGIGDFSVEEAWFQYYHSDLLKIKGGLFLTGFGQYNSIHNASPTNWGIRPPILFDEMLLFGLIPNRANLEISGETEFANIGIDYNIFFSNGRDVDGNGMDLNDKRAIGGRLGIRLVDYLSIGSSYYIDPEAIMDDEDGGDSGMDMDMAADITNTYDIITSGFDMDFELGNFRTYGEYYKSEHAKDDDQFGYFIVAGYTLLEQFTPFIEYDYYSDSHEFIYKNKLTRSTIGLNFKPNWRTALKIEWHKHSFLEGDIKSYVMIQTAATVLF